MAQGITIRLTDSAVNWEARNLRMIAWTVKVMIEKQWPALGDVDVSVFDESDFDYGRGGCEMKKPIYLGDGVYAQIDDTFLLLTTNSHEFEKATNIIWIEPEVWVRLKEYMERPA